MRRILVLGAALALLITMWSPATAMAAARPEGVTFRSVMSPATPFNIGTFTARGTAVTSDRVCPSGSVTDTALTRSGLDRLTVRKTFRCGDGTGTFTVRLQIHQDLAAQTETFRWLVLGGTGAYRSLRGAGGGTTESTDWANGPWTNLYVGFLIDPAAARPQGVTITSAMSAATPFNIGTFTASGDAVASDRVCPSGSVIDTALVRSASDQGRLTVRKTFRCDDGTGTFTVRLQIHQYLEAQTETFRWFVIGGTGAYKNLRGAGGGTTESTAWASGPWLNRYVGYLFR
ncbi:MAG: hypothetical protein ACXWXV_11270 [Aeromicrobium sp.]